MSDPAIDTYTSLDELYRQAADSFCELVEKRSATSDRVRISLAGGSTPRRLYEMLATRKLPWSKIHWFWGDERNVPADHEQSNYQMVRQALLDRIDAPAENVHPVPVDVERTEEAAADYEQTLREHFGDDRYPSWDLVLLGMGDDGHTASLFPETAALDENRRWFVANYVPKFNAYRYTVTAPAINSAQQCWFLVSGAAKRDALKQVLSGPADPERYPSQLIRPTRWLITADAAP